MIKKFKEDEEHVPLFTCVIFYFFTVKNVGCPHNFISISEHGFCVGAGKCGVEILYELTLNKIHCGKTSEENRYVARVSIIECQ